MEETLKKYRKGEKAAAKIMIEVARDRVALDARSEAQQERIRRQAEQERQRQEEKFKKSKRKVVERERAGGCRRAYESTATASDTRPDVSSRTTKSNDRLFKTHSRANDE